MATVQVILHGYIINDTFDTGDAPITLRFDADGSYETAEWLVPSFPEPVPSELLSEVRVVSGPASVVVDGPQGRQAGPFPATLVRTSYPSGKLVSFIYTDPATNRRGGVSLRLDETDALVVEELSFTPPAPPATPAS